jgi:hypothetical protein
MGTKAGTSWIVQEGRTPDRPMCLNIFYGLQQHITSLHLGELGGLPVPESERDKIRKKYIYCPGPEGEPNLTYEVVRYHDEDSTTD